MPTKSFIEKRIYAYKFLTRVNQGPWTTVDDVARSQDVASSFTGVQNPSWWQQVRYGRNATTIASGFKDTIIAGPFLASMTFENVVPVQHIDRLVQGDPHLYELAAPPDASSFPGLSDSVSNAVLTRFLLKCLAEQRKFQGGVVLGELRKTIKLIRNPLLALEKATHEYVRAVRGKSRRLSPRLIPRMLTEEYLSYTYGVLPLFHDIKGAIDACIRLRDLPQLVRVRAFSSEERQSSSGAGTAQYYGIPAHFEDVRYVREEARIIGAVKVQSVGPLPPLQEATGFKLRDFIPTVYELIPYSFLLDYVTNVGDIINALSFAQADLAWHCRTKRSVAVSTRFLSPQRPEVYFGLQVSAYSFEPTYAHWRHVSFSRDAQPLGLPTLAFKLPTAGQGVNIAALAAIRVL